MITPGASSAQTAETPSTPVRSTTCKNFGENILGSLSGESTSQLRLPHRSHPLIGGHDENARNRHVVGLLEHEADRPTDIRRLHHRPDVQQILELTARELTLFERKETIEREKALIQTIKDSGSQLYYLTEAERSQLRSAAARQPLSTYARRLVLGHLARRGRSRLPREGEIHPHRSRTHRDQPARGAHLRGAWLFLNIWLIRRRSLP